MAITRLPNEPEKSEQPANPVSERKIQAFINKGGKPTDRGEEVTEGGTKSIKLIMTGKEMSAIKVLRDKRPSRSRKIPISVHDWVIEAIQEKIEREQKQYDLTLI